MLYFRAIDQFEFPFLEIVTEIPVQSSMDSNEEKSDNTGEIGKILKSRNNVVQFHLNSYAHFRATNMF